MLLTLTTTHRPATDLGFLLRKHPDRHQTFDVASGTAHVLYPEATDERCTAALLLDIDPIALVRGRRREGGGCRGRAADAIRQRPAVCGLVVPERGDRAGFRLGHDRPVRGAAGAGRTSRSRWSPRSRRCLPRRRADLPQRLFKPLGYDGRGRIPHRLDEPREEPLSRYFDGHAQRRRCRCSRAADPPLRPRPRARRREALLGRRRRVEKLLRARRGLAAHAPEREQIARRYLEAPAGG